MNLANLMMAGARIAYASDDNGGAAPAADADPAATAATGAADTGTDAGTGGDDDPGGADTAAAPGADATDTGAKPKKPLEQVFKGRVGHLTKQLAQKDADLAAAIARAEAAERLLQASGGSDGQTGGEPARAAPAATPAAGDVNPSTGRVYTEAELNAAADQLVAQREFNRQADESYKAGKERFSDWEDAVGNLRSLGLINETLLQAALATDDSAAVIHHLGNDPEEAARIVSLPPARMGAEMAKLAVKLSRPADKPISGAPEPITPIGGRVSPVVDLERAAEGSMSEYVAMRAKSGAAWAQRGGIARR